MDKESLTRIDETTPTRFSVSQYYPTGTGLPYPNQKRYRCSPQSDPDGWIWG